MRRLSMPLLCVALACGSSHSAPAPAERLAIAVDPRVELLGILFRLAGNPETERAYDTPYRRAVDATFGPHRDHPAVAATKALHDEHKIAFDAPYALAIYLDPKTFAPIRPLDPLPPNLDDRWKGVDLAAYLAKVQEFARATNFEKFFASQASTFAKIEQRYHDDLDGQPILSFYDGLFGARKATYQVAPGLLTGPMGYGPRAVSADGVEHIYQVMSLEDVDQDGLPHPGVRTLEYLVHELGHSYVNPIFEAHENEMTPAAQPLLERSLEAMKKQAYLTPKIVVNESVVRALQVIWLREHASAAAGDKSLKEQVSYGFLWTGAVIDAILAVRGKHGGKLPEAELVAAVKAAMAGWKG